MTSIDNLKKLDVTNSMKGTEQAINDAMGELGAELKNGKGSASQKDKEILTVINQKLKEVDDAFDRPLDSPETFKKLCGIAKAANQKDLEKYCQEQVNMILANELHFKGYTAMFYGDCVTATKYLREAAQTAPKHPLASIDLEKAEKRLAKAKGELAKAEDGLAKDPSKSELWLKKANSLAAMGNLADSLPAFDKAISLDTEDAEALAKKGAVLEGLGKFKEAVPLFERALKIKPTSQIAKKGLNLAEYFTENK
jgi:tetratricopeptide (TPR) repeat protein